MRKYFLIFAVAIALVSVGCAKKKVVTEPAVKQPEQAKTQTQPAPAPKAPASEEGVKTQPENTSQVAKATPPSTEETEIKNARFQDVHFDFDRYDVKENDKPGLKNVADWLGKHPDAKLMIEGNCDERGTAEYNLALGEKRANSVKEYLVALGIPADRLETISYGKEKPICTEHNESCWYKNRRAHMIAVKKG